MPLFRIAGWNAQPIAQADFPTEKILQGIIENNLETIFNCRLVATEFSTGDVHGGRIDTLALSEDNNPVIIEYKKVASAELVLQSLFYLHWLNDHRGDFAVAVQKALGPDTPVDWTSMRVVCIAPSYKKYDFHAVQVMGPNIELWTYRRFANDTFTLEQTPLPAVFDAKNKALGKHATGKSVRKKPAEHVQISWTAEQRLEGKPKGVRDLFHSVQEYMLSLDASMVEAPKKLYVAYRTTKNIVCVEVQKQRLLLYVKLDPKKHAGPAGLSRDVSNIGHYGTGNLEVAVKTPADLEAAKPFLRRAYEEIGG